MTELWCSFLEEEIDIGLDCPECIYYEAEDPRKELWLCRSAQPLVTGVDTVSREDIVSSYVDRVQSVSKNIGWNARDIGIDRLETILNTINSNVVKLMRINPETNGENYLVSVVVAIGSQLYRVEMDLESKVERLRDAVISVAKEDGVYVDPVYFEYIRENSNMKHVFEIPFRGGTKNEKSR